MDSIDSCYQKEFDAKVVSTNENSIVLDQTLFYPLGGGQNWDTGKITWEGGEVSVTEKMISVLNDDELFFLFINEFSKVYKDTVGEFKRYSSSLYLKDMRIKKATIKKVLKDIASGVKLDFDTIIEYNT